jgi:hypothetical protein
MAAECNFVVGNTKRDLVASCFHAASTPAGILHPAEWYSQSHGGGGLNFFAECSSSQSASMWLPLKKRPARGRCQGRVTLLPLRNAALLRRVSLRGEGSVSGFSSLV